MGLSFSRRRAAIVLAVGMVGCTAIAGIQEGHPGPAVDGGTDEAPEYEAGARETGDDQSADRPGEDATDAGLDATVDAAADSPAPPPLELACTVVSQLVVDDLANYDSAGFSFIHGLWLAKTTTDNQVFVFTQMASDSSRFLEYDVDFDTVTAAPGRGWEGVGLQGTGIHLVDVSTLGAGNDVTNAALATYPAGNRGAGPITGVQVLALPSAFHGLVPMAPFAVGSLIADVNSGVFLQPTRTEAYWLAAVQGSSVQRYSVFTGWGDNVDASSLSSVLATSTARTYDVSHAPFFALGGARFAFVDGVAPDGGSTVFRLPDDGGGDASSATVTSALPTRVVAARPSAADPAKALVLAVTSDVGSARASVWSALAQPSELTSLAIGASPFVPGSMLGLDEVPVDNAGVGWMGDQTAIVGPRADGTGLNLLWLGPDGRAISHAGTGGPLVSGSNQVAIAAVQFSNPVVGAGATLFVAWIENVAPAGGQAIQRIQAAKVSCAPIGGAE